MVGTDGTRGKEASFLKWLPWKPANAAPIEAYGKTRTDLSVAGSGARSAGVAFSDVLTFGLTLLIDVSGWLQQACLQCNCLLVSVHSTSPSSSECGVRVSTRPNRALATQHGWIRSWWVINLSCCIHTASLARAPAALKRQPALLMDQLIPAQSPTSPGWEIFVCRWESS